MKLQLLGTGSRKGWPQPGCGCASCRSSVLSPRAPTAVLIEDLIHLGAGSDLTDTTAASPVLNLHGWQIAALGEQRLTFDVTGPLGQRLIYAPSTGPLPDATIDRLADARADVLLLEETLGGEAGPRHLSLDTFPAELVRLRAHRAITADTLVIAIGLGHGNPPADELAPLLWNWGVRLPTDAEVFDTQQPNPAMAGLDSRRTIVLGGTRSGKSEWAERQLAAKSAVTYVATAQPREDADFSERIRLHQIRRPAHWQTAHTRELAQVLATEKSSNLLIDDLGNWVSRTIDITDGWDGDLARYRAAATELVRSWADFAGRVILVSNDVSGGVHPATRAGRLFSDEMGRLNSAIAAASDEVVTMTAGLPQWLRRPAGMIVR